MKLITNHSDRTLNYCFNCFLTSMLSDMSCTDAHYSRTNPAAGSLNNFSYTTNSTNKIK